MAEYYGVTRTSEYLMHYGVRGMRWGVRKAIERGNDRALSRQYLKARKKLERLQARANSNNLLQKANRLDKVSRGARIAGRVGLGTAAAGIAGKVGSGHAANASIKYFNDRVHTRGAIREQLLEQYNRRVGLAGKVRDASSVAKNAGVGLAAAGYGTAIATKLRANALRKRASSNSAYMRKARQKANAWKQEMNRSFAGTRYAKRK